MHSRSELDQTRTERIRTRSWREVNDHLNRKLDTIYQPQEHSNTFIAEKGHYLSKNEINTQAQLFYTSSSMCLLKIKIILE
jgi:uncharacterized protein (UPF0216 family)